MTRFFSVFGALTLLLGGCGDAATDGVGGGAGSVGGAGGSGTGERTGRLLAGGPVEGVDYETDSRVGTTDSDGTFEYAAGEVVTFRVGPIELGSAEGESTLSPFDLVGITPPTGTLTLRRHVTDPKQYPAFHKAMNIGVLLQSLDQDFDASNGVDIAPEVVDILSNFNVTLDLPSGDFIDQPELRRALFDMVDGELFEVPHGVRSRTHATQSMYEALAIDPEVMARTRVESSNGNVQRFTYDRWGQVTSLRSGPLMSAGSSQLTTFGLNGELLELTASSPVSMGSDTRTYDAFGRLAEMHQESSNPGGSVNQRTFFSYNTAAQLTMVQVDRGDDGSVERIENYEYNDRDLLVRLSVRDRDEDGIVTEHGFGFEYDEAGRTISMLFDDENDGVFDRVTRTRYDEEGRRVSESTAFVPTPMPGGIGAPVPAIIEIRFYVYDDRGRLVTETVSDSITRPPYRTVTHEYDEQDRLIRTLEVDDGDETAEEFEYNELDLVVEYRTDEGNDSSFERFETTDYDGLGHTVAFEVIENGSVQTSSTQTNGPVGLRAVVGR